MVQTRSRATSSSPQQSRDASSNPHYDRQSAPAMQPSSVQHMQSMAAAMAELTHQNQELRREINLRGQRQEVYGEKYASYQGGELPCGRLFILLQRYNWKADFKQLEGCKSTYHLSVKFPTEQGVGQVHGDQLAARECYLAMLAMDEQIQAMNIEEKRVMAEPVEVLEDVSLDETNPERCTRIGADLEEKIKEDLIRFLRKNTNVFTWTHEDMPGIDPSVITHRLNIGRNVEVYVDDMLVKTQDEGRHLDDLQEAFNTLRQYHMKLNPSKCAFGVSSRKFLCFMVSHKGIKANPEKIKAILDMKPPQKFTPSYDDVSKTEGNQKWIIHVDGSSTQHAGGIGVVLQSSEGDKLKHKVCLQYQATNNEVEYEALLKGLELAKSVEVKLILILGDSQLIMSQVNGMYEAKEERMRKYLNRVMRLMKKFEEINFVQIPREENMEADTLAKEVSANEAVNEFDEIQYMLSIDIPKVQQVQSRENWMAPIVSYLKDG
nr:uncharacterized protein LOC112016102 [Quercus suber]